MTGNCKFRGHIYYSVSYNGRSHFWNYSEMVTGEWSLSFYVPHGEKWEDLTHEEELEMLGVVIVFWMESRRLWCWIWYSRLYGGITCYWGLRNIGSRCNTWKLKLVLFALLWHPMFHVYIKSTTTLVWEQLYSILLVTVISNDNEIILFLI